MNNADETKYQNEAKARADYLATAKKRMETAPIDELLMLVKKGSGEVSFLAGEEINNRIKGSAAAEEKQEKCTWTQQEDEECNEWETSCGDMFFFEDGTPEENGIKFCPFCGNPTAWKAYGSEPEEE